MPRQSRTNGVKIVSVAQLRDLIARNVLAESPNEGSFTVGDVTLWPHQREAVARLLKILNSYRGALLADEVGLGKTYTALAIARTFQRIEIVAPAALRAMWHEACSRTHVSAGYITAESLSRAGPTESEATIVLVDEAHWFRNADTKRYRHLAHRCRNATVLLLTATPLHNRPSDLAALLGLFMGRRSERLTPQEMAALIVRRGRDALDAQRNVPHIAASRWWRSPVDDRLVAALETIEPPVPLRDSALAMTLLRLTLVRRLASSHAALRSTLRRMLGRALALLDAVNAGRHPTQQELRSWLVTDEAIQLVLPGFLVEGEAPNAVSAEMVGRHIASLRATLHALGSERDTDRQRAAMLKQLMGRFPDARIVAFSQYETTVHALARALRAERGVAVLSAKGGRVASGPVSRAEVLRQFDARDARKNAIPESMRIRLLLTTDLLSEGVNLHNASVVVHLDIPWTPARLEQRVGRVSRLGSPHKTVHVFGFAPPSRVERLQRNIARLRLKWSMARRRFGESPILAGDSLVHAAGGRDAAYTIDQEALLRMLRDWLGSRRSTVHNGDGPAVAFARIAQGQHPLAIAVVRNPLSVRLVAIADAVSAHPRMVLQCAQQFTTTRDRPPERRALAAVRARLERYLAQQRAAAGTADLSAAKTSIFLKAVARAVHRLPRQYRSQGLRLEAALRLLLRRARSAGDVALLENCCERLLSESETDPLRWLEGAQVELNRVTLGQPLTWNDTAENWRIAAILIGL